MAIICLCSFIISCGGGSSQPGSVGGGNGPGILSISVTPNPLLIVPNSTITVTVKASGGSGTPSVTLGTLPAGLTTSTTFPLSVPAGGAPITLVAAANLAVGNFVIALNGQAGSATTTANISVTVQSTPTNFSFAIPIFREVGAGIGGGSGQIQFFTNASGQAVDYDIALSLSGLPPGTTATLTPNPIIPGQSTTIAITASSSAPISQNVTITLTGTPQAPVAPQSITFLLDVTQPAGSLPNNRTDYVSTEGSPFSAVYDSLHKLVFASNPSWNRVDVISSTTHAITASISVKDPRGLDISTDNSRVWVGMGGTQIYEINTNSFAVTRHALPALNLPSSGLTPWEDFQIFTLSDGTVMVVAALGGFGSLQPFIWDPTLNTMTPLTAPVPGGFGLMQKTGNGKKVYCFPADSGGLAFFYDVITKSFSIPVNIGGQPLTGSVNFDGSRVVAGYAMFDGDFNPLGVIPGIGQSSILGGASFDGGTIFSPDTGLLYEVSMPDFTPVILTIDPNTLQVVTKAPAMPLIPAGTTLFPPFFMPIPFAVDNTGMVLGLEDYGIAFDDATFSTNFVASEPGTPTFLQHMSPQAGPLSGGTTSGGFGNPFPFAPDVWYGTNRGTGRVDSSHTLTITSPPGSAPGPVHVKMLFPNGIEVFNPLFFSYGPFAEFSVQAGASPNGGSTGQIAGFGLPSSNSAGSITVAASPATITASSPRISSVTFGGYPFPAGTVSFAAPPGVPGFADVKVTTPTGTSTLPRAIFYAQSVTDFASVDTFNAILYDGKRQQLYLSAGDHIDVFSLSSSRFLAPLTPPALGAAKNFAGMALSPDGSLLLAADLQDGSLVVVDPDNPASSSAIAVAPVDTGDPRCTIGPLYVAASINNRAFVVTGGLPAIGCGPRGQLFQVDLSAKTSTAFNNVNCPAADALNGNFVASSQNGTRVAFNNCIYDAVLQSFNGTRFTPLNLKAISGDGNVAASLGLNTSNWFFADSAANVLGNVAHPDVFYGGLSFDASSTFFPLQEPKLNDAGSLYYVSYPNLFDIIDVPHGTLRMRFSLAQTVANVGVPMAIDSGGRHVYLLTNRGLTIVDLGAAPLSIGSLSAASATPGTQITVRGSGFNSLTSATVAGQTAIVSLVDENTINLIVPAAASGPADVVVRNSDGTSYQLESSLIIQ
ncbi:MAG: IPT/TIG domain-containing protein [Acidobacteriia bacterium]|nr:IPT/TIG domain-containing protein [Terriglobia bacterium]